MKNKSIFVINNWLIDKNKTFFFFALLLGVLPSVFSGQNGVDFSKKFLNIITAPFSNMIFFVCIVLLVLFVTSKFSFNQMFFTRYRNSKDLVLPGVKSVIWCVLILYIGYIFMAMSGAILSSSFTFENLFLTYEPTGTSILVYLIIRIIKNLIIYMLIATVLFLGNLLVKNRLLKCFLGIIFLLCYFIPEHFVGSAFLLSYQLLSLDYVSLFNEIIDFSYGLIFLLIIIVFLYFKLLKMKRYDYESSI